MAESGDVTHFPRKEPIAAFASAAPDINQSGIYEKESIHTSKRGSGTLRKTLFQVMTLLRRNHRMNLCIWLWTKNVTR